MIPIDQNSLIIGIAIGIIVLSILFFLFKPRGKKLELESLFELIELINKDLTDAQKANIAAHKKLNLLYIMFKELKK